MLSNTILFICIFSFLIHITETLAYTIRFAGLKTKQIAIAMSFVTSTLLVSRLSNMFQAPLLGSLVDQTILINTPSALELLENNFRFIIFSGFLGTFIGCLLTPTAIKLFKIAIQKFLKYGSVPKILFSLLYPSNWIKIIKQITIPSPKNLSNISLKSIPKQFLLLNLFVTAIYTIGVLCSLLAGAYLPEFRATAIQLSGIVNGLATIMLTLFVDPTGARITDQAIHKDRPESDVKSVVFYLQITKLIGTLIIAQIFLIPFTKYIMIFTEMITKLSSL